MRSIEQLRGVHAGATIYVFGSGAELDELDPADFAAEITVAMNRVPLVWPINPTYALTKYHADARELRDAGYTVVVGVGDRGYREDFATDDDFADAFVFDHLSMMPPGCFATNEHWPDGVGQLVVGPTVQQTALHFAAYLGASEIVAHGCSGQGHVGGYYPAEETRTQNRWLDLIRPVVAATRLELERRYSVTIAGVA